MASGAATTAAVAVFAILVLSSMGHPKKGPLCSDCGSLCYTNCTAEAANSSVCRSYCDNPTAAQDYCKQQVLLACQAKYCNGSVYDGTCSHDCNVDVHNTCDNIGDTTTDCNACKGGIFQSCYPTCVSNCNSTCVEKGHGCRGPHPSLLG